LPLSGLAVCGLSLCLVAAAASPAFAQTGGAVAPGGSATPAGGPVKRATLLPSGKAVAPAGAPAAVVNAIAAGNAIRKKPYVWGGGHASFDARGYDCSGAVSFVLNAAGMLSSPLPSGPLMGWGQPGKGRWISVFANGGHVYSVIAGLRWDTSAMGAGGKGPRWRPTKRSPKGFAVRHYSGY
jgi:hypothetical protein